MKSAKSLYVALLVAGTRWATARQRKDKKGFSARMFSGHFWGATFFLRFSNVHFSRRMTSPWPTSWSFSHKRYLYVAALLPGRGGPLSSRMPAGA